MSRPSGRPVGPATAWAARSSGSSCSPPSPCGRTWPWAEKSSMAGANPVRQLVSTAAQRAIVERGGRGRHRAHRHRALDEPPGRAAPGRAAPDGRVGAGARRAVRHVAARRAVLGPRRCRDEALRRDPDQCRRRPRPGHLARRARHGAGAPGLSRTSTCWTSANSSSREPPPRCWPARSCAAPTSGSEGDAVPGAGPTAPSIGASGA